MRKIFSVLLSLIMLMSTVFSVNIMAFAEDKKLTTEQAVDIYLANYNIWDLSTCDDYMPMGYRYGFLDLDFDGNLELITSKLEGSGRYSYNEFYTIDNNSHKVLKFEKNNNHYDEFDLFSYGEIQLYYYADYDKPMYYCCNIERCSNQIGCQTWGTISLESKTVTSDPIFSCYSECDNKKYSMIDKGIASIVTESTYNEMQDKYFKNTINLNVKYSHIVSWNWEEASNRERRKMLRESYNAFSYDKLQSIAVFSTEKSMSVCSGDEMWLAFGVLDRVTNTLDGEWKRMSLAVSNPEVVLLSNYEKTQYGYSLQIKGLKQGKSNIVITDTDTGLNATIEINVYDKYSKSYSYSMTDMPEFYPNNATENKLLTNIYNINGMYVNNYKCQEKDDKYIISFDIYNTNYYYGAIDIYDKDGLWIGYEEINKYSDIRSLWDTGEQAYFMIKDLATLLPGGENSNFLTYQQESYSKKTGLKFEVPRGGYFTISNNATQSIGTIMANGLEIIFDAAFSAVDLALSNSMKVSAFDDFKESVSKSFANRLIESRNEGLKNEINKKIDEILKDSLESKIRDSSQNYIKSSVKDKITATNELYENVADITDDILAKYDVDWTTCFKSSVGLGESFFIAFSGPAGLVLKGFFSVTKSSNKLLMGMQFANSFDKPYVSVYSQTDNCEINQNGVIVDTYGNTDVETVLQVFRVSDDKIVEALLDESNPFEKCEIYNICFVKNDQTVQPSGLVKVRISIPNGMSDMNCHVYRQESDGSWTILDAFVEDNYLVFNTEHFSNYAVVGEVQKFVIDSLPTKLDYTQGDTINTDGMVVKLNGDTIPSGVICDPYIVSNIGEQTITVKYGMATAKFIVNVKENKCNHNSTTRHNGKESTCQVRGEYDYVVCNQCLRIVSGKIGQRQLGNHKWDNGRIITCATCVNNGKKVFHCTTNNCEAIKTTSIPVTGKHKSVIAITKATTHQNGSVVTKCSVCGKIMSKSIIYYPKTIKLSSTSYTYSGKVKKPSVVVKNSKGKKIDKEYYTVSYSKGRKNVGKYTVTIKFKGNYSGTVKKTFIIKPKATSISELTAKSKGFTVKWKKQTIQTSGYQIQYATDKKFTKNKKMVTVSKNKTTSKKITKLKAKKKYYVRIRTYRTVKFNGKSIKIYSAWSKSKTVTTKK